MATEIRHERSLNLEGKLERKTTSTHPADKFLIPSGSEKEVKLSVVIPTLNEEAGIREVLQSVKSAIAELEIPAEIIVSDSSTDRTPNIAQDMGAIVVEPRQEGYGAAYQYAFDRVRGEFIAIGDADCTYDFEDLPRLLELVRNEGADIALGSRFDGEIRPGAMPALHRYVGNPILTIFLNICYDAEVSDAHSGFRVLTREALDTMDLRSTGMEFASEMIMEAGALELDIVEVPITYHERRGEATINSFEDGWRHLRFMLVNAPGDVFTVPGVFLMALGTLVMILAYFGIDPGSLTIGSYSMIAGSLLTIVGCQVASMGVFATIAGDPIQTPTDPITNMLVEHASFGRGASVGLTMVGAGVVYATYLTLQWAESGFSTLPTVYAALTGFTAIVIGLEVVFGTVLLSSIADMT